MLRVRSHATVGAIRKNNNRVVMYGILMLPRTQRGPWFLSFSLQLLAKAAMSPQALSPQLHSQRRAKGEVVCEALSS